MYQPLDAVMIRSAAWTPSDCTWPDLTSPHAPQSWRPWLQEITAVPGFADALVQASPDLASRINEICEGRQVAEPAVRRVVLAVTRYLLRGSGRATPFGLFAGITPARLGDRSIIETGFGHQAVAKVDAVWLNKVIDELEAVPSLLARLPVVRQSLLVERDDELLMTHRPAATNEDAPVRVRVRATPPVRVALDRAATPIRLAELAAVLSSSFPNVPGDVVDRLLADLVAQHLLITCLRAPMTVADPLGHLLTQLDAVNAADLPGLTHTIASLKAAHDSLVRSGMGRASADHHGGVDLRMNLHVTVPASAAEEAARAAAALVRLTPRADLGAGWAVWHSGFLERYGPHALIPLREVIDPSVGLGFPPGFLTAPAGPATTLTDRDGKLLALAQGAALRHDLEVVLDDTAIDELTVVQAAAPVQPSTEVTFRIHATCPKALDDGDFTLSLTGISRSAGTTTGRFLHLLDPSDYDRMRRAYAGLPVLTRGSAPVQLSAPPLYARTQNVARSPQTLPHLLPLGEYHADDVIDLDDLAVTADAHRITLIWLSQRRAVEPVALNAVEPVHQTHPLARFLLEAPRALTVPCTTFDWGAASHLPFLPALRYGRTLLSPARWLLPSSALPGQDASWAAWEKGLAAWRQQVGLPSYVHAGDGDQRLSMDLDHSAHRAVLRSLLKPGRTLALRAAPAPESAEWIGGRAHEIVLPLASTRPPAAPPRLPRRLPCPTRARGYPPGSPGRFFLKLYSHPEAQDAILTRYLPRLRKDLGEADCWFLRYHDPKDHLRLRLTVPTARSAAVTALLTDWTNRLRRAGLVGRIQWDTYLPEEGRFGFGPALAAAEAYFTADSAAVLAQLAAARPGDIDPRAVTAASMFDLAVGLLGDLPAARQWFITHACATVNAPARPLYRQAVDLSSPGQQLIAALPGGHRLLACWAQRRRALVSYRVALAADERPADEVLADLLHLHHARMIGPDLSSEGSCLHLARAAALSWTTRTLES